ncbi:MAG: hypothetical protein IKD77_00515 [Bacilli bacterium]|nr:hypothetical protein [Bacilli bacterium]
MKGKYVLEIQSKNINALTKTEDMYQFKVGEMFVEMEYSENNKSFNECMLNILKQKVKEG